ncbi:MAG: nitroreductase family protein [Chloroflexi bacterium]|nr:nitroreductase family protein [Chloroflexota bacterium]
MSHVQVDISGILRAREQEAQVNLQRVMLEMQIEERARQRKANRLRTVLTIGGAVVGGVATEGSPPGILFGAAAGGLAADLITDEPVNANQAVNLAATGISIQERAEAKEQADEGRRSAERDMFVQSLGAALQNMLLAAVERGLVGYLKGAPLFCAPAVREALELPDGWEPAFLVLLGHPEEGFEPPPRADVEVGDVMVER